MFLCIIIYMNTPDPDKMAEYLSRLLRNGKKNESTPQSSSVLPPEDQAYLDALVAGIHAGKRAIIILEENEDKLKYMFSNASRAEAVAMLGKVTEATGRRLANGNE